MAQRSPIYDWVKSKMIDPAKAVLGVAGTVSPAKKNSWEADPDDVRKANESFRNEAGRKKLTADGPTLGGKKKTVKKKSKSTMARKRE